MKKRKKSLVGYISKGWSLEWSEIFPNPHNYNIHTKEIRHSSIYKTKWKEAFEDANIKVRITIEELPNEPR